MTAPKPNAELVSCERCGHPFDPQDPAWDGHSRYRDTAFCRSCISRCHESTDFAHVCVICDPEGTRYEMTDGELAREMAEADQEPDEPDWGAS